MSKLEDVMLKHIRYIVNNEYRPFSYIDLLQFEVNGHTYNPSQGTVRNKFSKFNNEGKIELCYRDRIAFYSLAGKKFGKDKLMTGDHTEAISIQQIIHHPIYQILEGTPFGERAVHNLHLKFKTNGIYTILINNHNLKFEINQKNKGISFIYSDIKKFLIIITFYPTDTCKVVIGCSEAPIMLDFEGMNRLTIALCRIEERLSQLLTTSSIKLPNYKSWTITLWHIGKDSISEYSKEMFHCKWELAEKIAIRIYTKQFQDKKRKVRIEIQQNPNIPIEELTKAIVDKVLE